MWSNWGLKGSSCFIVCHHLELARSGSKECWTTHNAGFGIEQACVCLLRAWVSETQPQFMPLLKFGWWLCLLTTVVWIWSMVALLCGNLASWTPLPRIPSLCFWLERSPTEIPREICKVQVSCRCSHPLLLTCWLTWLAGGSDQTCNGSALCWILLWLLWPLGQVCLFSSRTGPGFYRIVTTKIRNKSLHDASLASWTDCSSSYGFQLILLSPTLDPSSILTTLPKDFPLIEPYLK